VKQNLSEAKPAILLALIICVLVVVDVGCVKRTTQYQLGSRSDGQTPQSAKTRININTASSEELEQLPGIGRVIAERIIQHRSEHGPFRRIEHVMMVRGISERKFVAIEPLIAVNTAP
jgi:competence ComEA-like helix-hairpin-helix protein